MKQNDTLVQSLLDCARTCDMCAEACLNEQDLKMLSKCIKLDMDCADVCYAGARLVERNSEIAQQIISVCEKICTMCADECQKHTHMKHCQQCAESCRKCAQECKNYHTVNVSDREMM